MQNGKSEPGSGPETVVRVRHCLEIPQGGYSGGTRSSADIAAVNCGVA